MKRERKIYQKWWFWIITVVLIGWIINIIDPDQDNGKKEPLVVDAQEVEDPFEEDVPDIWPQILDSLVKEPKKTTFTLEGLSYNGLSFKIGSTFTYDRYGDSYHYSSAERGEKYISTNVNIKSETKNPKLHLFAVYYLAKDSSLVYVNSMNYRFQRWEDYGTYLGNYHDSNNDFAYKETVKFAIGASIPDSLVNSTLFIVSKVAPSFTRRESRFSKPPVKYENVDGMLSKISNVYDWTDNNYILVTKVN